MVIILAKLSHGIGGVILLKKVNESHEHKYKLKSNLKKTSLSLRRGSISRTYAVDTELTRARMPML